MMRKGDAELQVLALLFFIATVAQVAFMVTAPQQYDEIIQRQVNDAESLIKSSTIRSHMAEEYVPKSLTDAAYEGMYTRGRDGVGPWNPSSIPPWSDIRTRFEDSVNSMLQDNYIGSMGSGAGCSLNGQGDVSMTLDSEEEQDGQPVMMFGVQNPTPLHVTCHSATVITDFTAGRSSAITELIEVPETDTVPRMRYQDMHTVAQEIASDATFQSLLNTAERSSTTATKTGCANEDSGTCGWSPPSLSFSDDDPIENEQEAMVGERLVTELENTFDGRFSDRGYELSFAVAELEYTPRNIQQVQDTAWLIQCVESDSEPAWTETAVCGATGCSDNACTLDNGAQCSNQCPEASSAPTSDPGAPAASGSGFWTENPWSAGCGDSQSDPYSFEGTSTVAYRSSEVRPLREYTRSQTGIPDGEGGVISPDEDGGDEDTCTPSCNRNSVPCTEYLGSESNTRASWEFDLESHTVVEVTITDTENEIPTSDGFVNPVYRFTFEQRNTVAAGESGGSVYRDPRIR